MFCSTHVCDLQKLRASFKNNDFLSFHCLVSSVFVSSVLVSLLARPALR